MTKEQLLKYLTVAQAAEWITKNTPLPISIVQVRRICRQTAAGELKGKRGIKADFIAGTWMIPPSSLIDFERRPRGPRKKRR